MGATGEEDEVRTWPPRPPTALGTGASRDMEAELARRTPTTRLVLVGKEPLTAGGQVEGVGVGEGVEGVRVQVLHDLLVRRGELEAGVTEHGVKVFPEARVALRRDHHHGVPAKAGSRDPFKGPLPLLS